MKPLLELLRMGYFFLGAFVLGCALVVLGIAVYLWLEEPQRLAARHFPDTHVTTVIDPQPLQVSLDETNVVIVEPPVTAYSNTNTAIWVHGKAFKSGSQAAWELVKTARCLWLLSAGTLICGLFLRRYASARKMR